MPTFPSANDPAAPNLDFLKAASGRRRAGRRQLRKIADEVAGAILSDLRVGDAVTLPADDDGHEINYAVEKVTWKSRPEGMAPWDEPVESFSPSDRALVRRAGSKWHSINDPRCSWIDEAGVTWEPTSRLVWEINAQRGNADSAIAVAPDDVLIIFANEASAVARAFAHLIEQELGAMDAALEALSAFGGHS